MAAVELPASPACSVLGWEPIDFGGTLQGPLGGMSQRVNRLGNRWRVNLELPPMTPRKAGEWSAALSKGLRNGVTWKIRQVTTPTGSPGTPLVAGASQTGDELDLDGFNPGYRVRVGQWLSVSTGGRLYLYQASATVMADASGVATVAVEPPLRISPADNDPVEFGLPYIQGLLASPQGWVIDAAHLASGFSFAIEEQR